MGNLIKMGAIWLFGMMLMVIPARATELYLWDQEDIARAVDRVHSGDVAEASHQLMREAENALKRGPYSVTDKSRRPPGGDIHDFSTLSPYFWPVSFIPGGKPYYFRDGKVNPEARSEKYDRERYFGFMRTVQTLALAYRFSGDERYAERAATLLRVWFIDDATSMNPNFNHAQVIPGLMDGCALGVIRGSELVMILDASRLVAPSRAWRDVDEEKLKAWYSRYLDWVLNSVSGNRDGQRKNNHGTWHDVHVISIALYVGRDSLARRMASQVPERRFHRQINAEGKQKYELKRSRSWEYSLYNLRGLYALANLAGRVGVDLWNYKENGVNPLLAATRYLASYASGEKEWPYDQINKSSVWGRELGACVFRNAVRHYGEKDFGRALAYLDDLDASSRLWLLHDLRGEAGETASMVSRESGWGQLK